MHGKGQDSQSGKLSKDPAGRLNPIQIRHADIHDDQIGPKFLSQLQRHQTVLGLTQNFHVRLLLKDGSQTGPHDFVIVCQQNFNLQYLFPSLHIPNPLSHLVFIGEFK
jgi:hypothetical protein